MKRKLKGWKKADRFYILNMQRGNAFTKEEDTFQMKIIKRLLSFIFLCVIIAGGVLGYKGYEEYKKALSEESVKEMAARIEEQPNYTTIDELPQTYIDAVLSVEDKRFYDHFGVDPIAVGRAFFNDVKAGHPLFLQFYEQLQCTTRGSPARWRNKFYHQRIILSLQGIFLSSITA